MRRIGDGYRVNGRDGSFAAASHRRHIGRQIEMHRPGRRCQRQRDRPRHRRSRPFRLDLETRLDQRAQQRRLIDDLMRVARPQPALDDARDHQQRVALLRRVGDAVDGIGKARPQRRHQQAGDAAIRRGSRRHHRRRRLVAGEHEPDPRLLQRIDQRHHLAAGHAEGVADAAGMAGPGDDIGNAAHAGSPRRFLLEWSANLQVHRRQL